jgi:hypothetical protein
VPRGPILGRLDFHSSNGRIGLLFMVGSACFAVASIPAVAEPLGPIPVAAVYFIGSIWFTAAALLQWRASRDRLDLSASAVQFAGTLLFNVSTGAELYDSFKPDASGALVWSPDVYGSAAFLIASAIAQYVALRDLRAGSSRAAAHRRRPRWPSPAQRLAHLIRREWHEAARGLRSDELWIASLNTAGSVAFGISALAAYVVPDTKEVLNAAAVTTWTLIGALLFFAAAFLLVEERTQDQGPSLS